MPHRELRKIPRQGFTLVELLAVIVIVTILIALGFPLLGNFLRKSRGVGCANNLRQISAMMESYLADNNFRYPLAAWQDHSVTNAYNYHFWAEKLVPKYGSPDSLSAFVCPGVARSNIPKALADRVGGHAYVSYGLNRYGVSPVESETPNLHPALKTLMDNPSRLMLMLDMEETQQHYDGWYWTTQNTLTDENWKAISKRHQLANVLFCDGHIEPMKIEELRKNPSTQLPWGTYMYTRDR